MAAGTGQVGDVGEVQGDAWRTGDQFDEFVAVVTNVRCIDDVIRVAERIQQTMSETIEAAGGCEGWPADFLYPEVTALQPDVVMVMVTSWDLVDRRWDTVDLLAPTDPPRPADTVIDALLGYSLRGAPRGSCD